MMKVLWNQTWSMSTVLLCWWWDFCEIFPYPNESNDRLQYVTFEEVPSTWGIAVMKLIGNLKRLLYEQCLRLKVLTLGMWWPINVAAAWFSKNYTASSTHLCVSSGTSLLKICEREMLTYEHVGLKLINQNNGVLRCIESLDGWIDL